MIPLNGDMSIKKQKKIVVFFIAIRLASSNPIAISWAAIVPPYPYMETEVGNRVTQSIEKKSKGTGVQLQPGSDSTACTRCHEHSSARGGHGRPLIAGTAIANPCPNMWERGGTRETLSIEKISKGTGGR
jgi:hypothetical protein